MFLALTPNPTKQLENASSSGGYNTAAGSAQLGMLVGQIINIALGVTGMVLFCLVLYAGFQWMTAGGNEDKIERATKTIRNCVIGLIIVLCSYAISAFVINQLGSATVNVSSGSQT